MCNGQFKIALLYDHLTVIGQTGTNAGLIEQLILWRINVKNRNLRFRLKINKQTIQLVRFEVNKNTNASRFQAKNYWSLFS